MQLRSTLVASPIVFLVACASHTLFAPQSSSLEHSTTQPAVRTSPGEQLVRQTPLDCALQGRWKIQTPNVGDVVLIIAAPHDGANHVAQEGSSNFEGTAEMRGKTLEILFHTGTSQGGYYEWTLDDACSSGEGKLVITAGGHAEHASTLKRLD